MAKQYLAKLHRSIELGAIGQNSGCIDRSATLRRSPLTDAVKVFERKPQRVHARMANRAGGICPMLLHSLAHGQNLTALRVLLFNGWNIRRRRRMGRAQEILE